MLNITVETEFRQIDQLINKISAEELVREIALIAEQVFVDQSPIDTGLLRANWFVTENGENNEPLDRKDHIASNPPQRQSTLFVKNNINYAEYANLTSYRPMYIEKSLEIIRKEIAKIDPASIR